MALVANKTSLISISFFAALVAQYGGPTIDIPGFEIEVPKQSLMLKLSLLLLIYLTSYLLLWFRTEIVSIISEMAQYRKPRELLVQLWAKEDSAPENITNMADWVKSVTKSIY